MAFDWKTFFERMSKQNPHVSPTESDMPSQYWENLYQAFKERLLEEAYLIPIGPDIKTALEAFLKENQTKKEEIHVTVETRPQAGANIPSKAKRKRTSSRRKPR